MVYTMINKNSKTKASVIVLSHGSKVNSGNEGLFKIAKMLKIMNKWHSVEAAFLQIAKPSLSEVVDKAVAEGATSIIIIPLILFNGNHVSNDIPLEIDKQKERYPDIKFLCAKNLGADERIAQIATDRINEVLREESKNTPLDSNEAEETYISNPDAIANESFDTIDKLLDIIGIDDIPEINLPIIKRIIHTTGDPEYGRNFVITPGAVEAGIEAIIKGKSIVTDVNMVKAGIIKNITTLFGNEIVCKIADSDIATKAKNSGLTRAITAINESITELNEGIVAVGNAPSALFHVIDLIKKGKANPALIIGVPVGFVGAAESKEVLMKMDIPYITNIGRKGGSPIAVTIVNAILKLANEKSVTAS